MCTTKHILSSEEEKAKAFNVLENIQWFNAELGV